MSLDEIYKFLGGKLITWIIGTYFWIFMVITIISVRNNENSFIKNVGAVSVIIMMLFATYIVVRMILYYFKQ